MLPRVRVTNGEFTNVAHLLYALSCFGWRLQVTDIQPLVEEFYCMEGNGVGGGLHIVLDDGNLEDNHIEWCIKNASDIQPTKENPFPRPDPNTVILGKLILKLSMTQRRKLYMRY